MKKWISVLLAVCVVGAFGQAWYVTAVDTTGNVGLFSSMVAQEGEVHIAYYDATTIGALRYAFSNDGGSSWTIDTADDNSGVGGVGMFASLDVGPNGEPQVAYYDANNTHLKWARRNDAGQWFYGIPDDGDGVNDVGQGCDIVVDDDNLAHISYFDATAGYLMYSRWLGDHWGKDTVDSVGPLPIFGTDIKGSSITLDPNGDPRIAYHALDSATTTGFLKYAYLVSGEWIIDTVYSIASSDIGHWPDITIREQAGNAPYISHYDNTNAQFRYERWTGSSWAHDIIDNSPGVGSYGSQKLGPLTTHVSYYDAANGDLKWGYTEDYQGWHYEALDTTGNVGMHTSIDLTHLGDLDFPHITYYDADSGDLKYANFLIKDVLPVNWYFKDYPVDMREIHPDSAYTPVVTVRNQGNTPATFDVEFLIRYSGFQDYVSDTTVGPLDQSEEATVELLSWSKEHYEDSWYFVYVYTKLADDSLPGNDTIYDSVYCIVPAVQEKKIVVPATYELSVTGAEVKLAVPALTKGELYVLDVAGRRRLSLHEGDISAGVHEFKLDENSLPNGVYFVKFSSTSANMTRKTVLVH